MKLNKSEVFDKYLDPISGMYKRNTYSRVCPVLEDESWVKIGVQRTLSELESGRGFIEKLIVDGVDHLSNSHYFESLKSERRMNYCQEINKNLIDSVNSSPSKTDPFMEFPELNDFDMYAGDGHSHKAPIHEIRVFGKKYSTQHFYALNIRNHMLSHLALAEYGDTRKKEHDMRALKRLNIRQLRQIAKKGKKVLYVWDKAGVDFYQWQKWKMLGGVYFLSLEIKLNKLHVIGEPQFDKDDQINAGVQKYETVTSANGISFRRVIYQCPETGDLFRFLTNLPRSIRPGVIAYIYRARWDIERKFNSFKHKLHEKRAWANTIAAKTMQATFICLTHNLLHLFGNKIEKDVPITERDIKRQTERKNKSDKKAISAGRKSAPHLLRVKRVTEYPKKIYRWLRSWIFKEASWEYAVENLKKLFFKSNYSKVGRLCMPQGPKRGVLTEKLE